MIKFNPYTSFVVAAAMFTKFRVTPILDLDTISH